MAYFLLYLLVIFMTACPSNQVPQIFVDKKTCEIFIEKNGKLLPFTVPAKIIAENHDHKVLVSLCNKNAYIPDNKLFSTVILFDRMSGSVLKKDVAIPKPYDVSEDGESIIINLQNTLKCNEEDNYFISIRFGHRNSKVPLLNMETDCSIEIEMANLKKDPPCMHHVDGKWFIDFTPLRRKPPLTFTKSNGDIFKISLCAPIRECRQEAGCVIVGNETTVIGSLEKLNIKFDSSENKVMVESSNKPKKSMKIFIKCNWDVPNFLYTKILNNPNKDTSNYKFEVQSSYGCVKTPKSCVIKDDNLHLTFDLRGLSMKNGYDVASSPRPIRLSICGDLQMKWPKDNQCSKEKSQVCEITGSNYLNLGSIPIFRIENRKIKAIFIDGHTCTENESYSTVVEFKCSQTDRGPVFESRENCRTKITWETPKACPKFEINEERCDFSSDLGSMNLAALFKNDGYTEQFSSTQKLVYNVCGKLNFSCSTSDEVSACFMDGNTQKIIGWNKSNLLYSNGKIQLKYTGEKCDHQNKPYSLTMNFRCSFDEIQAPPVVSKVDDCSFVAMISTISACLTPWEKKNCTVDNENDRYDLSPLIKPNGNYEINDGGHRDITYFLNLCTPVVPRENSIVTAGSSGYMLNSSESLFTEKFKSLGSATGPRLMDDKLLVESVVGDPCNLGPTSHYSSRIFLECSDVEEGPNLSKKDECQFDFMWKTRHACPIMKKGGKCSLTSGDSSTTVPGDPIETIIDGNTYHFSLCLDYFKVCKSNGFCSTRKLSRNIQIQNGVFYVQCSLNNTELLKTVSFKVECNPYQKLTYTKQYVGQSHLDVFVKTGMVCPLNDRKIARDVVKPEQNTEVLSSKEEYKVIQNSTEKANSSDEKTPTKNASLNKSDEQEVEKKQSIETEEKIPSKNVSVNKPAEVEGSEAIQKENASSWQKLEFENNKSPVEDVSKILEENEKKHLVESRPKQKCDILEVKGKKIDFKDLESKEFKVGQDTYIFNLDGSSSKCPGYICKNGNYIVSFIEECPMVSFEDGRIILNYSTDRDCPMVHAVNSSVSLKSNVEIALGCNDKILAGASDSNCKLSVNYSSPKICDFTNSSSYLVFFIILLVLLILFIVGLVIYVVYTRNIFGKCFYDKIPEDVSLVEHSKML